MGNDGGTIPRRFEIVKQTAKATKLDEKTLRKALFAHCALSKRPLEAPLVACGLGNLYNKDAILEFLLQPTKYGEGPFICPHITSLKDVADLKGVTFNPHYRAHARTVTTSVTNTQHHDRAQPSPLLCPLTLKECNGSNRFEFNWGCGCLYAQ
ncbi:Rtf2 RING-finger-domain-containing protein, partial [Dimargaris cristalligena]